MKDKLRKSSVIALTIILVLALFTGCTQQRQGEEAAEEEKAQVEIADEKNDETETTEQKEKRIIIDQNNREVEIPHEINRVAMLALPLTSVYFLMTGNVDNIVGMHPGAKDAAAESMLRVLAPEVMDIESDFIKGRDLNIEELMKLDPCIVIFWGGFTEQQEMLEKIGIPAIAVKATECGSALNTLHVWLDLLGQIFDMEDRATEIIEYGEQVREMIAIRTQEISEEEITRGLILFRLSEKEIVSPGPYGQKWLEETGAVDVTAGMEGIAIGMHGMNNLDMEQIYALNPEVIFLSNFCEASPEDILNNTIEGQDWSLIQAVKDGRVYRIPIGIYIWYPPSGDIPLMLKWMATKNYPEIFADISIEKEISEFFQRFYGYELSDEHIRNILEGTHVDF
ncbi:MAG: ABC transporter substrate-binding protein [Clostridiales bacterium]|nr:ABC transporter substrate-binding protein [Clostridiales bacterium]